MKRFVVTCLVFVVFSFSCARTSPTNLEFNTGTASITAQEDAVFFTETLPQAAGKEECHASSITQLANGKLFAAWYAYAASGNELEGSSIYTSIKDEQGWEPATLTFDTSRGNGNPVVYAEGNKVWLFHAVVPGGWSTAHIEYMYSDGQDNSWSPSEIINGPIGSNVKFPPIRLMNGELLLPAYDDLLSRSLFFASSDGKSWSMRSTLSSGTMGANIQPSVVQLENGRLLAVMRDTTAKSLWVSCSDDDGRTWSTPESSGFINPASPAAMIKLASGRLLLVFNNADGRVKMSAAMSADDGVTWTVPKVIAEGESSYPTAIQTDDGLIHVVYSVGRAAINHVWFNEAWVLEETK
jgi:predicted neuraminidase